MTELHDGCLLSAQTDRDSVATVPQDLIKGLMLWAIGSLILALLVGRILPALGQNAPTADPLPSTAIISEEGKPPAPSFDLHHKPD
jgi:hypothetical protein